MLNHIITYDLVGPVRDYDRIIDAIEVYDSVRLTESCWLVHTSIGAADVKNYLKQFIDEDDKLAVIKLGDDWATRKIDADAVSWLKKYV